MVVCDSINGPLNLIIDLFLDYFLGRYNYGFELVYETELAENLESFSIELGAMHISIELVLTGHLFIRGRYNRNKEVQQDNEHDKLVEEPEKPYQKYHEIQMWLHRINFYDISGRLVDYFCLQNIDPIAVVGCLDITYGVPIRLNNESCRFW